MTSFANDGRYGANPDLNFALAQAFGYTGDIFDQYGGFGSGGFQKYRANHNISADAVNQFIGSFNTQRTMQNQMGDFGERIKAMQDMWMNERDSLVEANKLSAEQIAKMRAEILLGGGATFQDDPYNIGVRYTSAGRARRGGSAVAAAGSGSGITL